MGFIDHITHCNNCDFTQFFPWSIDEKRVGYVHRKIVPKLLNFPYVFNMESDSLKMSKNLNTAQERSQALEEILKTFIRAGEILDEKYAVCPEVGQPALMTIDRGAADLFGILSTGFHLNGIVQSGQNLKMWVATRAKNRGTFPGLLDNMVAGGQPAGLTLEENVIKECHEEASIEEKLARRAVPSGQISYTMQVGTKMRRHVMYVYDLELPSSYRPTPLDGEVEKFELLPIENIIDIVKSCPNSFKFNCNLVIIDFLIRHCFILVNHPDYHDIVNGLKSSVL